MNCKLSEEQRERIASLISSGDRIEAIGDYITITGCGLTEAQKQITAFAAELHETSSIKAAKKKQARRGIFRSIVGKLRK